MNQGRGDLVGVAQVSGNEKPGQAMQHESARHGRRHADDVNAAHRHQHARHGRFSLLRRRHGVGGGLLTPGDRHFQLDDGDGGADDDDDEGERGDGDGEEVAVDDVDDGLVGQVEGGEAGDVGAAVGDGVGDLDRQVLETERRIFHHQGVHAH